MAANGNGLTAMALLGCHELDPAMAVPVVVPVHKRRHPQACLLHAGEWPPWVIGPVFCCAEQRFRVGVVVANPWSREGPQHPQLFQAAFQRGGTHCVAVIGMQDQRLLAAFADPLAQAGSAHQIGCNGWVFSLSDIPGHHLPAPDVDH